MCPRAKCSLASERWSSADTSRHMRCRITLCFLLTRCRYWDFASCGSQMYVWRPLSGRAAPRRVTCELLANAGQGGCAAGFLGRVRCGGRRVNAWRVRGLSFSRLRVLTLSRMFVGAVCFARVLGLLPRGAMVLITTLQPCEEPLYAWPRSSATRAPGACCDHRGAFPTPVGSAVVLPRCAPAAVLFRGV